jgi:hypothetical protein
VLPYRRELTSFAAFSNFACDSTGRRWGDRDYVSMGASIPEVQGVIQVWVPLFHDNL